MDNNEVVAPKSKGMDLQALDTLALSNRGIEITIFNPKTDEDTDIKIRILGQDSDEYRKWQRKSAAQNMDTILRQATGGGKKREAQETMIETAEERIPEQLAATTLGWSGVIRDGAEFPYSRANAIWLYTNYPLVRDQVLAAQRERSNFLAG